MDVREETAASLVDTDTASPNEAVPTVRRMVPLEMIPVRVAVFMLPAETDVMVGEV